MNQQGTDWQALCRGDEITVSTVLGSLPVCSQEAGMIRSSSGQRERGQPFHPAAENQRKPVASEPFVPEPLLDTDQAAAIMRIHPKTLQRYARQGIVRGFQLGSMWRFRASDIDRWISEQLAS